MPKVPTYDNFQTQVSGRPNVQLQAPGGPAPGAIAADQANQQGQALTRAGGEFARIAAIEQQKVDDDRVNDSGNELLKLRTKLQVEALSLTGRAALERPDGKSLQDEFAEKLDKASKDLSEKLSNENQRRAFAGQAGAQAGHLVGVLGNHVVQQSKQFRADTQQARVDALVEDASALYGDKVVRDNAGQGIREVVADVIRDNGWDAEKDKALIQTTTTKALTPLHLGVLRGLLSGDSPNVEEAKAYYDAHSLEMTPQAKATLQEALHAGDAERKAQQGTERAMDAAGGDPGKALAWARATFTGKDQDSVVMRIKALDAEKTTLDAHESKRVSTAAWSSVMSSGKIAPTLLAELRAKAPEEERQIRDWQESKWRRAKADAEGAKTDGFDTYYGLRMMSVNDPASFAALDLRKSEPLLGKSQLNHLVEVQAGISKGDAKAMETGRVVKSTLGLIKSEVAAVGIDLSPKEGTPAAVETNKFMGALTMALDTATKTKGSPLTDVEAKRIGMSMVRVGVEQRSGVFGMFQTQKKGYQIATDPSIAPGANFVAKRYSDIPEDVRQVLTAEYRAKFNTGTRALTGDQEAEIERAYTRGIDKGRF